MKYINHDGYPIDINELQDRSLVRLYKWFLKYYNSISKIKTEDDEYRTYIKEMGDIKDNLKLEIARRKLKMSKFV